MDDTLARHENAHCEHDPHGDDQRPDVRFCKMPSEGNAGNGYEKDQKDGKIDPFGITSKDLAGFEDVQREERGGRHSSEDVWPGLNILRCSEENKARVYCGFDGNISRLVAVIFRSTPRKNLQSCCKNTQSLR